MAEENKERILEFLKKESNSENKFNVSNLMKGLNKKLKLRLSYAVILKWVDVLKAEGLIKMENLGNVKYVWYEGLR